MSERADPPGCDADRHAQDIREGHPRACVEVPPLAQVTDTPPQPRSRTLSSTSMPPISSVSVGSTLFTPARVGSMATAPTAEVATMAAATLTYGGSSMPSLAAMRTPLTVTRVGGVASTTTSTTTATMRGTAGGADGAGGGSGAAEEEDVEHFLTNGSIALAEFTSLLKPLETSRMLKEHIIHLLRDIDSEETLMRITRALESQETLGSAIDVSATTLTGSSQVTTPRTDPSQSTLTSSFLQQRSSVTAARRDVPGLEGVTGLSFLHARQRQLSLSAQETTSSAPLSEDLGHNDRSVHGLGALTDTSYNSHTSQDTKGAEERCPSGTPEGLRPAFLDYSASQLSETTAATKDDPLLSGTVALPPAVRREGRRVAVSAASCIPPVPQGDASAAAAAMPSLRVVAKTSAEEVQLRRLLRRCHTFASLEPDSLECVMRAMEKVVYTAGTAILEQDEGSTEKLYLISEGTCEAIKNGKSLGPLQPGSTFGELELMYQQAKCAATVRCVTRCVLFTLDGDSYHRVVMANSLQHRQKFEKLTLSVPFLRCLPDFERMKVAEALETRSYRRGQNIIRFGSPGKYMHFIVDGTVKVVGRNKGRHVEVVRLRSGDVVGELEFLFDHLTVADVVATSRKVQTACISREHFELILGPIHDRLKEFVATSSTYEKYYVAEAADESVRSELCRLSTSRRHRRIASRDQSTAIGDMDPHGEVLLSAPVALLHDKGGIAGAAALGGRRIALTRPTPTDGPAADEDTTPPMALLRFPFAPVAGNTVAVLALREDGLIIYWNEALEKLTSYTAEDVLGQNIYSFLLEEQEQQSMLKAISTARAYAGEVKDFFDLPEKKSIECTLARRDGITRTVIRLTIVPSVLSAGNDVAEVVLGFGEEVQVGLGRMLEQPEWLSGQIRFILADGTQSYEERLECIAETLNNFESVYRAMTVSKERLRVVSLRQMLGYVLMDFGSRCVSRGVSVRQRFDSLPTERAYLDAELLPKCLSYAMKLCLRYSDPAGSVVTIMVTVTEKNGLAFLVINFNLSGDGVPESLVRLLQSSLQLHRDSTTTHCLEDETSEEGDDSVEDVDSAADTTASVAKQHALSLRQQHELRHVQDMVEKQGGTLRMLRNPHDTNIAFLIPFLPASEHDGENATGEEGLPTQVETTRQEEAALQTVEASAGPQPRCTALSTPVDTTRRLLPGDRIERESSSALTKAPLVVEDTQQPKGTSVGGAAATVAARESSPSLSFTTCLAEDTPAHRIMLSSFLWERHHAVLTAFTFADIQRLVGVADILVVDLQQSAITSLNDPDPITRLCEMLRHMAVIITCTAFDLVSSDTYAAAGFITLKKPCTPLQAMNAIRSAEERSAVMKLERMRIEQTRETLSRNSRGAWRRGSLLGKGSFGAVYEAFDVLTGGKMAVKEIRLGNNNVKIEQFVQEISTMCSLQHPNIIHYFYCEESIEQQVIRVFMEYAGGGTLQSLLKRKKGKMDHKELRALLCDIVEGLAYIHSQHYVHGDIKTSNVLLSTDGKGKIGDFGTARTVGEGELLYVMQGSPLYMSPECMSAGEEDEEGHLIGYSFPSDIWSLGCVAMEMATNKPPFAHIRSIKGPAGLTTFVTSLKDVPDLSPLFKCDPSVVEFVSACLNPDPLQRATAQELRQLSLFSESTHGDCRSAIKALRRAQLLHELNKFVAFQEPQKEIEAREDSGGRHGRPLRRRISSLLKSRSSSGGGGISRNEAQGSALPSRLVSQASLSSAAELELGNLEERNTKTVAGANAARAAPNGDQERDVGATLPRRSGTVACSGDGGTGGDAPPAVATSEGEVSLPAEENVKSTEGKGGVTTTVGMSAATSRLRQWSESSSSMCSSSTCSIKAAAATVPATSTPLKKPSTPEHEAFVLTEGRRHPLGPPHANSHRDPMDDGMGGADERTEPDPRNPHSSDPDDLSPTPKKRSKTRPRPSPPSEQPRQWTSPRESASRYQESCTTVSSAEAAFFETSPSDSSRSSDRSDNPPRDVTGNAPRSTVDVPNEAARVVARTSRVELAPPRPPKDLSTSYASVTQSSASGGNATRAEAAAFAPSYSGRRRNVVLNEAGEIVSLSQAGSSVGAATPPTGSADSDSPAIRGERRPQTRTPGEAANRSIGLDVRRRQQPLVMAHDAPDGAATSPGSATALVNSSLALPPANLSFYNYSFNKNISFMGNGRDEALASAANDFLQSLAANTHIASSAGLKTPLSSAAGGTPAHQRSFKRGDETSGDRRRGTVADGSGDSAGDVNSETADVPSAKMVMRETKEGRGGETVLAAGPLLQFPSTVSHHAFPVASSGMQAEGDRDASEGIRLDQRDGKRSAGERSPLLSLTDAAGMSPVDPVSSPHGSGASSSWNGARSTTPRGASLPLVGVTALPGHTHRRLRPPITNQSFFVVESSTTEGRCGGQPMSSTTGGWQSSTGGGIFGPTVSFTTASGCYSIDGDSGSGARGGTRGAPVHSLQASSVAVVAPPPLFSANNPQTWWQQQRRRRQWQQQQASRGVRGAAGGNSMSTSQLPAPLCHHGSGYLMAIEELEKGEEMSSNAFFSVPSGISRHSSSQSMLHSILESNAAAAATAAVTGATRPTTTSPSSAEGTGSSSRGGSAGGTTFFDNLTTEAESPLFTYLQRIDRSLQDVSSQLQLRQRTQRRAEDRGASSGQDYGDVAPPADLSTSPRPTSSHSGIPSTTMQHASTSALLLPLFSGNMVDATAAPASDSGRGSNTAATPAGASRPLTRHASVSGGMGAGSKQRRTLPPSFYASPPFAMQPHSHPLRATGSAEGDAWATGHPEGGVRYDTPLSSTLIGSAVGSSEDVSVEALLRTVLRRVNVLLEEVSHVTHPVISPLSPRVAVTQ